jgi:hypothetical protein
MEQNMESFRYNYGDVTARGRARRWAGSESDAAR